MIYFEGSLWSIFLPTEWLLSQGWWKLPMTKMKLETRKRYLFDTQNNYLWLCMTFHTNLCCKRVNLPKFFVNRFLSEYPYDIDLISYIFTVFFISHWNVKNIVTLNLTKCLTWLPFTVLWFRFDMPINIILYYWQTALSRHKKIIKGRCIYL